MWAGGVSGYHLLMLLVDFKAASVIRRSFCRSDREGHIMSRAWLQFVVVVAAIVGVAVSAPSRAETINLLAPADQIIGGQSDTTANFTQGDAGTAAGANNWPPAEPPPDLIDGLYGGGGQKYLNFAEFNTGVIITPSVITGGTATTVTSMTLWVANDAEERDPATYELYGTNNPIVDGGAGTNYPLSDFTLIQSGDLSLPSARNASTESAAGPPFTGNNQTVAITNSTSYTSYLLIFPTVKTEASANSMQLSEVQFRGEIIPEPSTFVLAAFGLLGLIGFGLRRKR